MATANLLLDRLQGIWADPPTLYGTLSTVDHKRIAKRYLVTAFAFLMIGGLEALFMRAQLSVPNADVLDAETYNQMMSPP